MRFLLLTLLVAACGGQPVSSTQCMRVNSLAGERKLGGCLRYPDPMSKLTNWLQPKATALFSQQQANGQHCLYEGWTGLAWLKRGDTSILLVRNNRAVTEFSLAAEDVSTAMWVQSMTKEMLSQATGGKLDKLKHLHPVFWLSAQKPRMSSKCFNAKFLYHEAGDIFRRNDFALQRDRLTNLCGEVVASKIIDLAAQERGKQLTDNLRTAEQVFGGEHAVVYYDVMAWGNPFLSVVSVLPLRKQAAGNAKKVRQIKKILPWVRSSGASVCPKQASI